ncbi:IS1182 family transposase [Alicyclobacillus sp. SO9]|uniref:IS1182 family transposase n=1 Tax=Alicyclobacillus sp. SO9 TaxID=2665646 RepID=UPI0018E7859D|nr:IS1182 family transposase [Alicyclobacillus sp. SO9]QQE77337.1 IS1182 family transposase [Alicyclobacillus sp. SO9]QQE78070.1 IS1182 family transposase [Alicyclobacillus sp. SO9]QQE79111.1 IS1182 family transposase [Alicyclobacillus sp. SO9]
MSGVKYKNFEQASFEDLMVYSAIPPHPFWDMVAKHIDFSFANKLCAPLYSPLGQHPYAPSLKLKIHLIQRYYNISDREMELKIVGDIFIKRFLGVPVSLAKFDHSTIALDRSRLGADIFHACHMNILAQALNHGMWGQDDDRWLVDAFHTYANVAAPSTYELIQQAAQKLVRHLKRRSPAHYAQLKADMDVGVFFRKLKRDVRGTERNLAFSNLCVLGFGLVAWMKRTEADEGVTKWEDPSEQETAEQQCEVLLRILRENVDSKEQDEDSSGSSDSSGPQNRGFQYAELGQKEKPADRVVSAHDPEVRIGHKSKKLAFLGDKTQVVESASSHLVLNAEPIPGNEADGVTLENVVKTVVEQFDKRPKEVVADAAYGSGENRDKLVNGLHIHLTAPLTKVTNPSGKAFRTEDFTYLPEDDVVVCPEGQRSVRRTHIKKSKGSQYGFAEQVCGQCSLRGQCTDHAKGRTVFVSDYWALLQEAKKYNASAQGQEALRARYEIERTNNEMKRHHGLERPRTRGRKKLRIDVKITSMVVNVKVMVKTLVERCKPLEAPVCS